MVGCDVSTDVLWFYHGNHTKDRCCVCSMCMDKWPDLCCNFSVWYYTYSTEHQQPACTVVTMAQAVCCSFITHLHLVCQ